MRFIGASLLSLSVTTGALAQATPTKADQVPDKSMQLAVTFMQQEAFAASVEAWSGHIGSPGYWQTGRFGGGVTVHAYQELDGDGHRQHVDNVDGMLGYAMDSRSSVVHFRSVFLFGYATLDRHIDEAADDTQSRYTFFETRQGFNVVPPTHEAQGVDATQASSLLEIGAGFRWNFFDSQENKTAGAYQIPSLQIFPYLAAVMSL
jgi:hypothetical protein